MLVLFVCVANVGRSQMAEAFFNRLSTNQALSAGTQVGDQAGQNLRDRSKVPAASSTPGNMLKIMQEEEHLDLYDNLRKQLTPTLADEADRVVVMCESDPYPEYLSNNPKVTFWKIEDLYGTPYESVRQLKEEVKRHVEQLVREIG
ncbi:MAG: low molecular weight phosphatase family protein [Chloroflexi bacterium]|nr:low molecular weight phosphatase family protein [Chloroflexota bacterium]MDA1219091.1 low molecular weight phosphatase family protein [Chloroflexota bacterium]